MLKNESKYYRYVVLFAGDADEVEPILHISDLNELKKENRNHMHLFDELLIPTLPAIEYCLHLPRWEMDTYDTPIELLDIISDVAHDIIIMPEKMFLRTPLEATLIICTEACNQKNVEKHVMHLKCELGVVSVKELNNELLIKQWNVLYQNREKKEAKKLSDIDMQFILNGDNQMALPALNNARQYSRLSELYRKIFNTTNIHETCAKIIWNQRVHHNGLMYCDGMQEADEEQFKLKYVEGMEKAKKNTKIDVVITMPGIPVRQMKYGGLEHFVPENEKRAIRVVGLHRAIARDALLIELPQVQEELYRKLDELEINCKQNNAPNNNYVKKILKDMGRIIEKNLSKEQLWAIDWAEHITVFSDFPIGLAILSDADTSLHGYKNVSYRALSPLTRCMQIEMMKRPLFHLGGRCKVVFAECVPDEYQNSLVRSYSKGLRESLEKISKNTPNMSVVYKETLSITDLKEFIADNMDADILHISAHGHYDRRRNVAGLMIGNEFWMADENDFFVPPVVVLSACHVSPRGGGTVNVADLFIRAGAMAVLGSFIPISARRNMFLLNRLYIYIAEAQKGNLMYETILDAWAGVVCTNAILEIQDGTRTFSEWIMGINKDGISRFQDFALKRSVGKLHGRTMYADTIAVIKEMLKEEGLEGKFDNILSREDYFPESFFYQWMGYPENIFLNNERYKN